MNLLPKSVKDFGSKTYWDSFFRKRQNAFEWYGEYSDLCDVLHKYCKPKDHVLVAGCGNSQLSQDMYDVGYRSLVNIDISDVVIKQMEGRNKIMRPEMSFLKMDLLDLKFEDESFQVVIDKGTLDAIFTSEDEKIVGDVNRMLAEISRILKISGRYICITLAQEHILRTILNYFSKMNWFIRVHKVNMTLSSSSSGSPLPVFAFVFTKTRQNPDCTMKVPQVLEIVADQSERVNRLNSIEELKTSIQAIQEYALVKQHLKDLHPEEHFQLHFWSEESFEEPRYSLTIVDQKFPPRKTGEFAIFIVPQGREHEWMFSVKEGQLQLAVSAGFQRLVIVALNRGHLYANLEKVKEELSCKVMGLAQDGVGSADQVPFLSIGEDVGNRKQIHRGKSAFTGDYVIEDVHLHNQETFRHLIFLSNRNIVQSEARLCSKVACVQNKSAKKKGAKKNKPMSVDLSYLACQHHQAIVAGFALSKKVIEREFSVLLVGLGGGSLPMFINNHFPQSCLTVVEIDPDIVQVAKSWFSFQESERMKLVVCDGLDFIKENSAATTNGSKYDIVIFDIDSKDTTKSLSCPPSQFAEEETLQGVKRLLNPDGSFILNLVCRDKEKKQELVNTIQEVYAQVFDIDIEDEVNEIMICRNNGVETDHHNVVVHGQEIQGQIAAISPTTNVELTSLLENLKII